MKTVQHGFDLLIPVYNEGINILKLIKYIKKSSKFVAKIYICYDFDDDSSVHAIKNSEYKKSRDIILLKNIGKGACEAIKTGIFYSKSLSIITYPADDFCNGQLLDKMYDLFLQGYDMICPSRFMKGGSMKNCPLLKYLIVRFVAFTLFYVARIKVKDPTNGFRMFSRKLLDSIPIKSKEGFAHSVELLVKANRFKFKIIEIPSIWIEREDRKSSFKIFKWSRTYLRWYFSAFFK